MFLLLDCSYSARTTKVTLDNGTVKTRLELETEATFQLIESLLIALAELFKPVISIVIFFSITLKL